MGQNKLVKLLVLMIAIAMVFTVAGCDLTPTTNPSGVKTGNEAADVPADRYDAIATPRTGNNATVPLVVSTGTLDGKFNPFFATSAYDVDVAGQTQLSLLYYDKKGAPEAGVDIPCVAYDYTQEVSDDESMSTYTFVLKNGLTFSDGEPMTVKDVLFSIYVLSDPQYDGSSTFYTMAIQGMSEYRLQTSSEALAMVDKIIAAGITSDDDGNLVINAADGVTVADAQAFWGYMDAAGAKFAQEIIDYVNNNYTAYIPDYFPPYTAEQVAASDTIKAAFGMVMWGFGSTDADTGAFTDSMGTVYDLATDTVDATVYWNNILDSYGYDITDAGINYEKAGEIRIEDYVKQEYLSSEATVEGGVQSISGITTGTVTDDEDVVRDYIKVVINGVDPTAIFKLGVSVVPFHYYTEGYTGTLNENGVELDTKAFMDLLKTKNSMPVGAGPYVFQDYTDNVVTYKANDSFLLGAPKIETLRYQEIAGGSELDSIKTGTVHFTDPSATTAIVNDITAGEGDYAKLSYTLVDNDGYGYIGIQGQAVPEFEVRKALAYAMNVQLSVDDYYGELASVNYRTMTKILWAYPENPANLFPYDETGETSKALFLEAGYTYDEATNVMSYPADHEKAGTQVSFTFTLPMEASDHPAGSIFVNAQKVLATIGVLSEIEVDANLLGKLTTAYDSGIQCWAAAWGSGGVDPDMFQIWYSDPSLNQGSSSTGLFWLFANGSDEEKTMLTDLNELITAGRATLDTEERKEIYKNALELSTGIAVEIPTYQRKNMYVYNKDVIDSTSIFSGEDVTPFQGPLSYIWNVELVG